MPDVTDEEREYLVITARLVHDRRPIEVELTRWQLWCLGSLVQLACRHPANTGPVRREAERTARGFAPAWAEDPDLARLWELGWDPVRDEPPAERPARERRRR